MRNITVKNIPDDLYDKIKTTAHDNRRSINNEIINRLDRSLKSAKLDVNSLIRRIETFHNNIEMPLLTDDLIQNVKQEGRS
ncbi:Arc family DNA-binding protein [bacterium]|nr:Arc family DNA-binding protein [bacterium]